jgi:hypothetical protein
MKTINLGLGRVLHVGSEMAELTDEASGSLIGRVPTKGLREFLSGKGVDWRRTAIRCSSDEEKAMAIMFLIGRLNCGFGPSFRCMFNSSFHLMECETWPFVCFDGKMIDGYVAAPEGYSVMNFKDLENSVSPSSFGGHHVVIHDSGGIKIGCQTFTASELKRVKRALTSSKKGV